MNGKLRMTDEARAGGCSAPRVRRHSPFVIHHASLSPGGFTLVEIIIAMTILMIIAAAAVPTFQGLKEEQIAREPLQELSRLAKEARLRAMKEKRPYQIAFHAGGFTASRYLTPYLQLSELNEFLAEVEQKALEPPAEEEETANQFNATRPTDDQTIYTKTAEQGTPFAEWTETYKLRPDTHVSVQFWYDFQPAAVEGEIVKLWVFQPTGICQPLKVGIEHEAASAVVEFDALTADIVKESSEQK